MSLLGDKKKHTNNIDILKFTSKLSSPTQQITLEETIQQSSHDEYASAKTNKN